MTGEITKDYVAEGRREAMRTGTTVRHLAQDHLGSTAFVMNASGGLESHVRYYPYGMTWSQSATPATDRLFTGHQQMGAKSGTYYANARFYSADIGRFPQPDSILPNVYEPQALSRYTYVANNPTNYTDPTGHDYMSGAICCWQGTGGGGGGSGGNPPPGPYDPTPIPAPPPPRVPTIKRYSGGPVFLRVEYNSHRRPDCPSNTCEFFASLYATILSYSFVENTIDLSVDLWGRDAAEIQRVIGGWGYATYGRSRVQRGLEAYHSFCEPAGSLCRVGDLGVTMRGLPSPREVKVEFAYLGRVSPKDGEWVKVNLKGIRIDVRTGVYYPIP